MKTILLYLKLGYWRFQLREAREFAYSLERTISRERMRSVHDLREAETMERRAELALIAHRADSKRVAA